MNEGLFKKYIQQILSHSDAKQKIIITLFEKTGVSIGESEINISGKTVIISTSSTKRTALLQKGYKEILHTLGYAIRN